HGINDRSPEAPSLHARSVTARVQKWEYDRSICRSFFCCCSSQRRVQGDFRARDGRSLWIHHDDPYRAGLRGDLAGSGPRHKRQQTQQEQCNPHKWNRSHVSPPLNLDLDKTTSFTRGSTNTSPSAEFTASENNPHRIDLRSPNMLRRTTIPLTGQIRAKITPTLRFYLARLP